ncbi:MAG: DegT/DnrJ/EryC1/StrS aminotransferase family protein, partial [Flavobacteriales bacterium]|nr:DegT/DnrJ/EryC1/StrS aminotransferase family protein [Flavobacteriales bacterium]
RINGQCAGALADVGIFSFGMIKSVTSFNGGMVVTNDESIANKIQSEVNKFPAIEILSLLKKALKAFIMDIATYPIIFKLLTFFIFRFEHLYCVDFFSSIAKADSNPQLNRKIPKNYLVQLTPMQARIALQQLPDIETGVAARIDAAQSYYDGLKDIKELVLPPLRKDGSHNYCYYPIQYENRDELVDFCMREFRDIALSHHKNCASLPCFKEYERACPNAEAVANSLIYLPTYPTYSKEEIERNVQVIKKFFKR